MRKLLVCLVSAGNSERKIKMKTLITTIAAVVLVGCGPQTPDISIHDAAYEGNIGAVEQYLAAGTDVNAKDKDVGTTGLHGAVDGGRKEIAELLIAAGANVNENSKIGTPLHLAAMRGHKEIAELLIAKGADVMAKHQLKGLTPLHQTRTKEVAELLIAKGADVNDIAGEGGWGSPLHHTTRYGVKEVAELLIFRGANVNAKINSGRNPDHTPLDVATESSPFGGQQGRIEIADLLRKHGGKTGKELKAAGK